MTGTIVRQYSRQHSSTSTSSKMDKTYPSEIGSSASANEQSLTEVMPDDGHHKENLFSTRKTTTSDHDSGTEDVEQQLDDICIRQDNDHDDQSSVKSFGPAPDDGFFESEIGHDSNVTLMENDIGLAKTIPDEIKKDFCGDTRVACHGEFGRLILMPLALRYAVYYRLFAEEELANTQYMYLPVHWSKVDNAKAQFKCPNKGCNHVWTSMRARILFSVTTPDIGHIKLKIFGQNCQHCNTYANALWYIDEICRVMKNFAFTFYQTYFPDMLNDPYLQNAGLIQNDPTPPTPKRHDPYQRRGKMLARHARERCEACQRGLCFA